MNGDTDPSTPREFLNLAKKLEEDYIELVKPNIVRLETKHGSLVVIRQSNLKAYQELSLLNTLTQGQFARFLKRSSYIALILEGGRPHSEKQERVRFKTFGEAANSIKKVSSTSDSKSRDNDHDLILQEIFRCSTRDLVYHSISKKRLIDEFLMTWSEDLLGDRSPLLESINGSDIALLNTLRHRHCYACVPYPVLTSE